MSRLITTLLFVCFFGAAGLRAQVAFPDDWFTRPPTPERIKAVQAAVLRDGWQPIALRLYAGSLKAYELRQEDAAVAWYYVARWSDLLGQSQAELAKVWMENQSRAGIPGLRSDLDKISKLPDQQMSLLLTEETVTWLLGDRAFSEAFFNQVSPHDLLPRVMFILENLRESDARRFATYTQLALAIALVYDAAPPPHWPHGQVSVEVLPRRLPNPTDAFKFLTEADQRGVTLHKLANLPVGELRFAVDLSAPFGDLVWAQRSVKFPLATLVKSYEAVRYRTDRIEANEYAWASESYSLPEILKEGGICVDQAYFATQAGKARGVPTLLFAGSGKDGRHAWFGYLGTGQRWVLDAGRYAEQRFVTGVAYDPQTWKLLSDHELLFLSEGFRKLQPYRQSKQQQIFAEVYFRIGKKEAAAVAARKAVNFERRNADAWAILVAANYGLAPLAKEALLREASQALQRYPDLAARFTRELVASLNARGEKSAAEFEERSLVRRGQMRGRDDFAVTQAAAVMAAAIQKGDYIEHMRVYRQVLKQYGKDGGIDFYDRVTEPFVIGLLQQGKRGEAVQMLAQTRVALTPEPDSQMDREMKELADKLK